MIEKIRIERVCIFLLLTFLLSWGFDGLIIYFDGVDPYRDLAMSPWGMLVPAFVALILQRLFLKDSPLYYRVYKEKPHWILDSFLILTVVYAIIFFSAALVPQSKQIFQGIAALLYTLWTLLIFFIHSQSPKSSFAKAGLSLGNIKVGSRLIAGIVFFFLLQAAFIILFGLGDFIGQTDSIYGLPIPSFFYIPSLIILFITVTTIGIPLSGLAGVFGEEYGWRGFLLSELIKMGKIKAVLLVGLIWGIWHFPVIFRGAHSYPASAIGLLLAVIFFVLWGVIQGYAILKTGSIWIAAFMHGVVNSVYNFSLNYLVASDNNILSFNLGIYGLICLGIIVFFIFLDKVWKGITD
jgi:membrane protease YdiL (CAAX protease family)